MTDLVDLGSDQPVDTASLDRLACTDDDLQAVLTALEWARAFLASPHPDLGRKGPVCPYIRHSFDERLLHVTCRPDESCQSSDLVAAVRATHRWFAEIQRRTPEEIRHLVTVLVVLPRIDRSSAEPLNELHRVMKDEFVGHGLMIGQFHPACEAPGLWNPDFRPLRSPIPLLAIREMVSSDLPFLIGSPMHANEYLERFAALDPGTHTSVPRRAADAGTRPATGGGRTRDSHQTEAKTVDSEKAGKSNGRGADGTETGAGPTEETAVVTRRVGPGDTGVQRRATDRSHVGGDP